MASFPMSGSTEAKGTSAGCSFAIWIVHSFRRFTRPLIISRIPFRSDSFGIGTTIVTYAFTLLFGALALGLALAFGLGCKDMVKKWVEGLTRN